MTYFILLNETRISYKPFPVQSDISVNEASKLISYNGFIDNYGGKIAMARNSDSVSEVENPVMYVQRRSIASGSISTKASSDNKIQLLDKDTHLNNVLLIGL
jgi:hypothetical protein